jgi:hypothetical protein
MEKLTLQQAKDTTVFYIDHKGEIQEDTLYDRMLESLDETTTPRGVGPRLFLEEKEYIVDTNDAEFEDDEDLADAFKVEIGFRKMSKEDFEEIGDGRYSLKYFVISSWGPTGNRYQKGGPWDEFLTEKEAEEQLFEYLKVDFDKDWDNSCNIYYSREEAEEVLLERMQD